MKINEIDLSQISQLKHRSFICQFEGKWNPTALILEFSGRYGWGSCGNDDADFISMIRSGHLAILNVNAVVYDFRNLDYEWGNRIWNALRCPRHGSDDEVLLPSAMVVSDRCRQGFSTCAAMVPPMFETLEDALACVERPARHYVDELMEGFE